MTRVAGVVPTAGRSQRMGRSKALLDAGGASFLSRVACALRDGGCAPVLVVVRRKDGAEAAVARKLGAGVVVNPDPEQGPISSLRSALEALEPDVGAVAWCPVDHPRVSASTVTDLVSRAAAHPHRIVVPRHGDRRGHPVIFPRSVFAELLDPALEGGARTVVRRDEDRVLAVPVDDPAVLSDIDTPEAYRRHFGSTPPTPTPDP